ncbi:MAG TPA: TlpA disulfide reductase family protein [Polyangiaceae bacterium]|nr:TlpA disulfide reductase family protein [Polyangiaceae bacterium]
MLLSPRVAASVLCVVVSMACGASQPPPPTHPSPLLGYPMPSFESRTISGNPVISASFERHKVVVTFVASKCKACEQTLSAANAVYKDDRELVVVGVYPEKRAEGAVRVASRLELRFPVVVDEDGVIARRFQVGDAVPTTFVVDSEGRVQWVGGADLTAEALERAVAAAR